MGTGPRRPESGHRRWQHHAHLRCGHPDRHHRRDGAAHRRTSGRHRALAGDLPMTAQIDDADLELLLDIADVLIPPTDTMPALRDADVDGQWLGRAAAARNDLLPELRAVLHGLADAAELGKALRE